MRRSVIFLLLTVILMAILLTSRKNSNELFIVGDSTPEQTQNSPTTTPVLEASSEYDTEQYGVDSIGETTGKKRFSSMEEAYYYKYLELAEKNGTHVLYDVCELKHDYGGNSYLGGVCIVDFMDFNGDGIQDLFIVYSNGQMDRIVIDNDNLEIFNFPTKDTYEIELWTYKDGELIQISSIFQQRIPTKLSYGHIKMVN